MEVEFESNDLDKLETDATFNGGYSQAIVSAFRKRMQLIRSAFDERDFYAFKSLHFEKLKGNRVGQYSMRLNNQWRLIMKFDTDTNPKTIIIVAIEDYHYLYGGKTQ